MGGSSKKVTVGYRYYLGMHMILCHGPADKLLNITVDGRRAWSGVSSGGRINVEAASLFGGDKREGGVKGAVDLEMGLPAQGRNDYLEARLGPDIPAHRGVVGVVLRQCYLGLNPYLKKWAFRLSRVYKRTGGLDQWYPEKAAIPLVSLSYDYAEAWKYRVVSAADGGAFGVPSAYISPNYDDSGWAVGNGGFGSGGSGAGLGVGTYVSPGVRKGIWLRKEILVNEPSIAGDLNVAIWHDDGRKLWWNGEEIPLVQQPNYFHSTAVIPGNKILHRNVIVLQVLDSIPGGSPSHIYAGLTLSGGTSDQVDMNPAHIIRECLTDPEWGMGYQESDIDDASFQTAADRLYDEVMGISLLWDRQVSIESFIQEVIKHIDGALYVSRSTGKFVLKLIRSDYDENTLLELDPSNVEKIDNPSRPTFGELTNSVTVNYWDSITGKGASVTVQDTAMIQMQGAVINTTVQYPGFTNFSIASKVAQRDLRALSSALLTCTLYANQDAKGLNIGDVFKLTWPDFEIDGLVMRVVGLAFGDGKSNKVRITAAQDVFALPKTGVVASQPPVWEDPSTIPTPADVRVVIEAPYYELVQRMGQTSADELLGSSPETGYLLASARRPPGAINASLMVDAGAGYEDSGVVEFCPAAELSAPVGQLDTTLPITNADALEEIRIGSHLQLDEEIVRVDSIGPDSITVGRGVLDTTPAKHLAGTPLLAWDDYAEGDQVEYLDGETLSVRLLPVSGAGEVELSAAATDTLTMLSRAARPYPPGDFKVNGGYYPEALSVSGATSIDLAWTHRDRKQQTGGVLLDFHAGSVGPEAGVTYLVEGQANFTSAPSAVWYSMNVGAVDSHSIDIVANPIPGSAVSVTVRVWAVRDGLQSWQAPEATFAVFEAPYDLFGTYIPG